MCDEATGGVLDFCSVYVFFDGLIPEDVDLFSRSIGLDWLAFALAGFSFAFVVINAVVMSVALYTWFERRALGRFQNRLGPNRWGPFGLLQPFADVIKLMTKEDTVPEDADHPVFNIAPIVFLAPTLLVFSVIPFGQHSFLGKLNIGVLFIVAVTSVNTLGVFMAGWASRNKYAMLGAARGVAMLISYEIPMALAITGVALMAGSLSLFEIVEGQTLPFLLVQPLGALVFLAAASAEMSRAPFDIIEAESELGAGYHTEYSGAKFAVLQLAEFMGPIVTAVIFTTIFLSGWRGFDPVPGQVWFIGKTFLVVFFLLWLRATWPRLRIDQIMGFAWKALFPLSLVNLFAIAIEIELLQDVVTDKSTGEVLSTGISTETLWVMAGINWGITVAAVIVIANLLGQRKLRHVAPVASPLANMYAEAD